jgi:hypothetical protein
LGTTAGGTTTGNNVPIIGISIPIFISGTLFIAQNQIFDLVADNSTLASSVIGLFDNSAANGIVERNFIHSLSGASTDNSSIITGINISSSASVYRNNIISMNMPTEEATVYGIYNFSGSSKIYYNTVSITGSHSGVEDACMYLPYYNYEQIRNNIFYNASAGSANHYAAYVENPPVTTDAIDYNDYIGLTTNIGPNTHSVSIDPGFVSAGGTNPIDYTPNADSLQADSLIAIYTDYFDLNRCFPTMGAIDVESKPLMPDTIRGKIQVCPGEPVAYSIDTVAFARTYVWSWPSGWSYISGQGTTQIWVNAGTAGQNGQISVNAKNGCGNGPTKTLNVSVVASIPSFTSPNPVSFCVVNIDTASFFNGDITPERPEYYLFQPGDVSLDLDTATFTDNCCDTDNLEIHWQITFYGGSPSAISGTGQPSSILTAIQLPGVSTTPYADLTHTITYWLVNCNGNESAHIPVQITIKPRPQIDKIPP